MGRLMDQQDFRFCEWHSLFSCSNVGDKSSHKRIGYVDVPLTYCEIQNRFHRREHTTDGGRRQALVNEVIPELTTMRFSQVGQAD